MTEHLTRQERLVADAMRTARTELDAANTHERAYRDQLAPVRIVGMTDAERFWSKVDQTGGPNACWPWRAGRSSMGYGMFYIVPGRKLTASRYALVLTLGRPLRDGFVTCHTCDNPPCCNPLHLYEGTYADNRRDAVARIWPDA